MPLFTIVVMAVPEQIVCADGVAVAVGVGLTVPLTATFTVAAPVLVSVTLPLMAPTGAAAAERTYIMVLATIPPACVRVSELTYPLPANYKLNKVDGYCMMYEIPLNVKSTISTGKKINLFYTAGISSYFMKSEFYTYYYATNYRSYTKSAEYNSQKNYWLSVATLGLGIEKEITPTLNIAAMPFLKIPFKGMGVGNLKLMGTGINFTLSWKPPIGKKQ